MERILKNTTSIFARDFESEKKTTKRQKILKGKNHRIFHEH